MCLAGIKKRKARTKRTSVKSDCAETGIKRRRDDLIKWKSKESPSYPH